MGLMKIYVTSFKIGAVVISLPCTFLLAVNLNNFNALGVVVFAGLLSVFWGLYWRLRTGRRFAFAVSFSFVVVLWLLLLYQTIKRINFVLENGGMERPEGQGSPLAFLLGLATEQFFFVPLSAVVIVGLMQWLRPNKALEPTP